EAPNETKTVDSASGDIYALGITLIELVYQRPAFDAKGNIELVDVIRGGQIAAFDSNKRAVSSDLEAVLRKAVAKDPQYRYQTAEDFNADLENLEAGRGVTAVKHSVTGDLLRWSKRNKALAAVSVVAALLVYFVSILSSVFYFQITQAFESEKKQNRIAKESSRIAVQAMERILAEFSHVSTFSDQAIENAGAQARVNAETVAMIRELAQAYEQLAFHNQDDQRIIKNALAARSNVAEIYERLGDYKQATEFFQNTISDYEVLVEDGRLPRNSTSLLQMARLHNRLGIVFRQENRDRSPEEQHQKALRLLGDAQPISEMVEEKILIEKAYSHYLMGYRIRPGMGPYSLPPPAMLQRETLIRVPQNSRDPLGSSPERREHLNQSLAILDSMKIGGQSFSIESDFQKIHLEAMVRRELVPDNRTIWNEQDKMNHAQVVRQLRELAQNFPDKTVYRYELMKTLATVNVFGPKMDLELAKSISDDLAAAISLGLELVAEQPEIADYRIELAHAYFKTAIVAGVQAQFSSAEYARKLFQKKRNSMRKALDSETFLSRQYPDSISYRAWLARFSLTMAQTEGIREREATRVRHIEKALTLLMELSPKVQKQPEIAALIKEAKLASQETLFETDNRQ
ncbi:MAG: tetratricopeptide repeat-containing protein kinase family protein, partial [Planctomycetota bacterium]